MKTYLGLITLIGSLLWSAAAFALQATVTWNDVNSNEDGTKVERRAGQIGTFAEVGSTVATVKTFVDGAVPGAGGEFCYRVRDFNAGGNGPYSGVACKTFVAPPTNAPVLQPIVQDPQ